MLVDSHCHLNHIDLAPFGGRLAGALEAAGANGVERFLWVSIDLHTWPRMLHRVEKFPAVSVSVGVHPCADEDAAATTANYFRLFGHG